MSVQEDVATEEKVKIEKPRDYVVIFHNDDRTTFEFVIAALHEIFHKSTTEAFELTNKIHQQGSAVVAKYPKEIAEAKVEQTLRAAKTYGYPLKVTCEPE